MSDINDRFKDFIIGYLGFTPTAGMTQCEAAITQIAATYPDATTDSQRKDIDRKTMLAVREYDEAARAHARSLKKPIMMVAKRIDMIRIQWMIAETFGDEKRRSIARDDMFGPGGAVDDEDNPWPAEAVTILDGLYAMMHSVPPPE